MLIHWDEVCDIFCPKNNIFLTYSSDCLRPTPTRLAQTTKMDLLFCFEIHIQCLIGPNPMDPTHLQNFSILDRSDHWTKSPCWRNCSTFPNLRPRLIMNNKEFNEDTFIILPHSIKTKSQKIKFKNPKLCSPQESWKTNLFLKFQRKQII